MYDRLLEAVKKLKESQDELQLEFRQIRKEWDKDNNFYLQKLMRKMEEDLTNYTIQDGYWFYNGVNTGVKAEGIDGEDGKTGPQGETGNGIESITKTDSAGLVDTYTINYTDGTFSLYNVRNGKDGKKGDTGDTGATGAPGRDGKDGAPGRDGKDGISPIIKIGTIEVSPEYGGANAKLRKGKKDNIFYLDLVLPRGPQGFTGFDGKPGPKGDPGEPGPTGNGISSITKTSTSGYVDTYTITYTDGTTSTFEVTNGEVSQEELDETNAHIDNVETLSNLFDDITGTGTDITIDDTEDTMLKLGLSGNTYQFSTNGDNLLIPLQQEGYTQTKNGITLTVKENGEISLSGTSTANTTFELHKINLENGKTYYANIFNSLFGSSNLYMQLYASNYDFLKNFFTTSDTYTPSSDYTNARVYLVIANGVKINTTIKPMIKAGSQATDYEPYTGGQASPNPDYPQDIEVVTGDNEIKIQNKNLAPISSGIEFVYNTNNKYYENINTDTRNYSMFMIRTIYDIDKYHITGNDISMNIPNNPILNTTYSKTFVTPENTKYIYLKHNGISKDLFTGIFEVEPNTTYTVSFKLLSNNPTVVGGIQFSELQIEKGPTATPYETHKEQVYPINLGVENLANIENSNIHLYTASNGTTTENQNYNSVIVDTRNINAISVSGNFSLLNNSTLRLGKYNEYPSTSVTGTRVDITSNTTIDTSSINYLLFAFIFASGKTFGDIQNSFQIEKGSKVNSYTPYGQKPIELCKIGDYKDDFRELDGTWYKHAEIGKVVLDGSEAWSYEAGEHSRFVLSMPNIALQLPDTDSCPPITICDNFISTNSRKIYSHEIDNSVSGHPTAHIIWLYVSNYTSVDSFKNWLSTHNTELYYVLTTPTNTEITDTNLINQLNSIKYALAYKDQTNISQTNDEQPFIIDYETFKSISQDVITKTSSTTETLKDNKIYDMTISANTTFVLPEVSDTTKLHNIEIRATISNSPTINLGTTHYLGDAPEFSNGTYLIYYEYMLGNWYVGAIETTVETPVSLSMASPTVITRPTLELNDLSLNQTGDEITLIDEPIEEDTQENIEESQEENSEEELTEETEEIIEEEQPKETEEGE